MTESTERAAGQYVIPPHEFVDDEERRIRIVKGSAEDVDDLVAMYLDFHSDDRSQGVPPLVEDDAREWLDQLFPQDAKHVVAWHDESVVGQAFLIPAGDDRYELAIFVLRDYQSAHIGTELMYVLLGYGCAEGVTEVWLSVESWNNHAIALYENVGFQKHRVARTEVEMTITLDGDKMRDPNW